VKLMLAFKSCAHDTVHAGVDEEDMLYSTLQTNKRGQAR